MRCNSLVWKDKPQEKLERCPQKYLRGNSVKAGLNHVCPITTEQNQGGQKKRTKLKHNQLLSLFSLGLFE